MCFRNYIIYLSERRERISPYKMSILGVKKKHVDTSELEREILNMKSELLTMNTKNKYLYNSVNAITLRVLNIENIVSNIKNKPNRKIINIYAGIDGSIHTNQKFNFGEGGGHYVMNFPGNILNISLVSLRTNRDNISVIATVNDYEPKGYGISLGSSTHGYLNFDKPFKVKAGDIIGFVSKSDNSACINTLVSLIIEIFL